MALSFEGLTLTLSGRTVLSDVTATLTPGRVTAVLGPNGAGKSSLVRAAAGLVPVASGYVRLDGADIATLPVRERAQAIGYLPQDAVVHWNMPVSDVVALGRLPHRTGHAEDRAAIDAALAATDTVGLRD
ncbi:ABC transporter ATP-binding protein, partial [Sphingomonas sp. AOB5]|uniref:ATP-binding cassette domain-containing protein n=1 Tax=Sphingomonas sp. AOB5 TaxID=3034017 RepID=UPI0023F9A70F